MCIRDRCGTNDLQDVPVEVDLLDVVLATQQQQPLAIAGGCLLYTSDAADERSSVDLGGRRIIKKKNKSKHDDERTT